ncbi:hypothetical protein JCM17961_30040 [Endothiovibrio diazotrophicus]
MSDAERVHSYIRENGVDVDGVMRMTTLHPDAAVTILSKGLMEGIYVSWPDREKALLYVGSDAPIEPLEEYAGGAKYDLVISYTFDDRDKAVVERLVKELGEAGVRVYLIVDGDRPNDPIWSVRFREALFHSHYFSPYLSSSYLRGAGTIREMFDIAREAVHHRSTEYFYPILPLVDDPAALMESTFRSRSAVSSQYDDHEFDWLRTHVFPVDLGWGAERISRFISSLSRNYRGFVNYGYLRELRESFKFVEFIELFTKRVVRIHLGYPSNARYYLFSLFSRGCLFEGSFEPGEKAIEVDDVDRVVDEIETFFRDEVIRPFEEMKLAREADDSGEWLCMGQLCKFRGKPVVKMVGPNPVLGIHEAVPIYICPRCGNTMVRKRAR